MKVQSEGADFGDFLKSASGEHIRIVVESGQVVILASDLLSKSVV